MSAQHKLLVEDLENDAELLADRLRTLLTMNGDGMFRSSTGVDRHLVGLPDNKCAKMRASAGPYSQQKPGSNPSYAAI